MFSAGNQISYRVIWFMVHNQIIFGDNKRMHISKFEDKNGSILKPWQKLLSSSRFLFLDNHKMISDEPCDTVYNMVEVLDFYSNNSRYKY